MENKDVQALLDLLGISLNGGGDGKGGRGGPSNNRSGTRRNNRDDASQATASNDRDTVISRLMNITLHCLGAIRTLVVEEEKVRISHDCVDIDGSRRLTGTSSLLQRQLFSQTAHTLLDTIMIGRDLHPNDPVKDLIDCFPWENNFLQPNWFMLNWAIMQDYLTPPPITIGGGNGNSFNPSASLTSHESEGNRRERNESKKGEEMPIISKNTLSLVKAVLKYYPETITEVDKFGQIYLAHVLKSRSISILEELLYFHKQGVHLRDGRGKLAFHYAAAMSDTVEPLLMISEEMRLPMQTLVREYTDAYDNLPIHFAANGNSSTEVLNELLFCYPDSIKIPNRDGQLPLHIVATSDNLFKVKAIFRAYPNAISIPDNNGWLPIQHAAYGSRTLEVVKYLYECYPDSLKKPNKSGRLPIHYNAVKCLSSKIMEFLIEAYPQSVRGYDCNQRLPLHNLIARCEGWNQTRLKCLRLLLKSYPEGAGITDRDGNTPYDLALRDDHGPLVLRLLLMAEPALDPVALGELSYLASKAKFKKKGDEQTEVDDDYYEDDDYSRSVSSRSDSRYSRDPESARDSGRGDSVRDSRRGDSARDSRQGDSVRSESERYYDDDYSNSVSQRSGYNDSRR